MAEYGKIYKITNKINIGRTIQNIVKSFNSYVSRSQIEKYPLYSAIKKYGPVKFYPRKRKSREYNLNMDQKIATKNKPATWLQKPIEVTNLDINVSFCVKKISDVVYFGLSRTAVNNVLKGLAKTTKKSYTVKYIEVCNV